MHEVTCIGIIVADVIAKTVDCLPETGKLNLIEKLELHLGGCASNSSVDLQKLGISTAVIGKVGNDGFGEFVINEMKHHGVITEGIKITDSVSTSASVVTVNSKGERSFLHHLGANADFCKDDVDKELIINSKIMFLAGSLLMPKFDGIPAAEILQFAHNQGIVTVMDTAWDSTGRWMEAVGPCLTHVDFFIPSYEEAKMISGKIDLSEIADTFINRGVGIVVIKLGEDGCYIKDYKGEEIKIDSFKGINVKDTTGAGDAFAAGFITGLAKGWSIKDCGKFANAVGAHCVMEVGATTGIKHTDEILEYINFYEKNRVNHD